MMVLFNLSIWFIILLILGIILFIWGLYCFKRKRLMQSIPTSKIRSLAMGLVEIYGKVVPMSRTLKTPFTFLDCVYYRYTVQELRSSGKSTHWVTIKKGHEDCLFYPRDETGSVLINPTGAKISIPVDNVFETGLGRNPTAGVKQFLRNNSLSSEGKIFGFNKTMKFSEWFISPNDKLYILGTAADNPYRKEATASDSIEDVMITKGKNQKTYYITDKHEQYIIRNLNIYVALGLGLGSLLIIVSLLFL